MFDICEIKENVNLKDYNTYKINTSTKYLALPKTKEEIINLIKYLKDNSIKFFLLGNGSNVILPDEKFDGVVISLTEFNNYKIDGSSVIADAGAMLPKVAFSCIDENLKGLEWACGIPGTIGASVRGNAGAYLHDIFESLDYVEILDDDLNIKKLHKKDIKFDYRYTSLKDNSNIILRVCLKLEKGDRESSLELVKDRYERRKSSQPLKYPSAGSVFRNPDAEHPAGKLIEDLGLKGKKVGGAQISMMHANFIVNENNAKAKDIKELIDLIKKEVKNKYDIDLKCEQEIIDWN